MYAHPPPPNYPNHSPLTPPPPANDGEFRRALKDWESYATALTDTIIDLDPTIPELPFKDINFRIYRDIRFTNDPTPYKVPPPFPPPTPIITNPRDSHTSPPPGPAPAAKAPTPAIIYTWNPTARPS